MDREVIIPEKLRAIVARTGYTPAVKVGDTIYIVGQIGRTNPEKQFRAAWGSLCIVP